MRDAVHGGDDVLTIDKLTYAGRRDALAEVTATPRHRLVQADIADRHRMEAAFRDFDPDAVLHLAAETHVDRSIDDPGAFLATNMRGTFVLLEAALHHWSRLPRARRDAFRFVHVSTDEVFGTLAENGTFDANSRYAPSSPYAASKAAADHLARVWHQTYGLPVIITNCSNNYGPRQHAEKLIPTVIRHWRRARNIDLVLMICDLLDARRPRADGKPYARQITFVADRPGHDFRYAVDPSHAETALGWRAAEPLETGLASTIDWYLANADWLIPANALGRLGTRMAATAGAAS